MKFADLLNSFIVSSRMNKTEVANAIGVSPQYIMNICKGITDAPTLARCDAIARVLDLSPAEKQSLRDAAMEEKLSPDALLWLAEREKKYEKLKGVSWCVCWCFKDD